MTPLGLSSSIRRLQSTDEVQLLRLFLPRLRLGFTLLLLLRLHLLLLLALFHLLLLLLRLLLLHLFYPSTTFLLGLYLCHLRSLLLSLFSLPQCLLYENSYERP